MLSSGLIIKKTMGCAKYTVFRILDVVFLSAVFILQSVILSQYTIYSRYHAELPSAYDNPVYQKLLWLIGDFICLAGLLLACLWGFVNLRRETKSLSTNELEEHGAEGRIPQERLHKNSVLSYITSSRLPLCYISWFLYASLLTLKISLIFTSDLSNKWRQKEENHEKLVFGPQLLQLGIGVSAVIFSLLVEAQHNAGKGDPKRNAYLKSVSYEVALEILDTACLLSFLISSFDHEKKHRSHGEACPSYLLTPPIITLSAINLLLPTVTLYKLTSTKFGETYHVKLELIYKTLHLLLVNIPFLCIRLHLWNVNDREDVIFLFKNVYGIVGYFRGVCSDLRILHSERRRDEELSNNADTGKSKDIREIVTGKNRRCTQDDAPNREESIEMNKLL